MTESPPTPRLSKKKYFLILFSFLAVFYTVAPYVLGGILSVIYPTTDVELDTTLHDAKVTDVWMNRQYYLYYLDGDTWRMHDFNGFVPADSAARTGMNSDLGYNPSSLGHYLRRGDRLTKTAHSPELTTRRGSTTTHWILYAFTPEGMRPSPEKPPVWEDEDSIHIP